MCVKSVAQRVCHKAGQGLHSQQAVASIVLVLARGITSCGEVYKKV
jgi:hypothetical protein